MRSTGLLVMSLVDFFLPLFCVVDLETTNDLMPAARKLTMLIRLIIVPDYRAWCRARSDDHLGRFVLAPKGSMALQGGHIMNAPGIFWSTPHISGLRHLQDLSLVWSCLFLLAEGPEVVWWWLLLRKWHSCALCLTQAVSWAVRDNCVLFPSVKVQFFGLTDSFPSESACWSWHTRWCWS